MSPPLATIKRLTGTKLMAIEQEGTLLKTGRRTGYLFPTVKVDHRFRDGDKIELGGSVLTAKKRHSPCARSTRCAARTPH